VAGLLDLCAQGKSHSEPIVAYFSPLGLRCPKPLGHKLRANVWEASHIVDEIYLGSVDDAANLEALRDVKGITHIVCCVLGERRCVLPVVCPPLTRPTPTGLRPLYPGQFRYHLVPLRDEPDEVLEPYFDETIRFINDALAGGGRVFVHCMK
jgi:hypothetical protein